jgi:hypothetical protein
MMRLVDVILGLTAAVATAVLLGLIVHDEMGISIAALRSHALSAAGLIFAAFFFGTLLGRRKN